MGQELMKDYMKRLKPYRAGKPIEEVEREYGLTDVIKLASNENPLGPSPAAVAAMREAAAKIHLYPDGPCYYLKNDLAKFWGIGEDNVTLGNGSDELIHNICLAYLSPDDEIIQADVTFSMYEFSATLNGAITVKVPVKDMTFDLEAMADAITPKTKLIFITNPNNPTGTIVTADQVERFMARVPENVIVIFDEAYLEYVENPDYPDTMKYVREGRNVFIMRTFSKVYGLAGLRVGYAIAKPELIANLNQVRDPFCVNQMAQVAARASLADLNQVVRSRKANSEGKRYMYDEFDRMGLSYVQTEANFVLVNVGADSVEVFKALLARGVIIRTGDIFGLPTWIRVSIGTPAENRRFISELEQVLAQLK